MVRVKLIKLPDYDDYTYNEEEKDRVGKVFEAFEMNWGDEIRFALYIEKDKILWYVPKEFCEIIEDNITEEVSDNNIVIKSSSQQKILLVEDGSVDIDSLEEWCNEQNIKLIVYRNGANKPEWLNL